MLWLAPRRDATIGPRCPTADLAAVPSRNLHVAPCNALLRVIRWRFRRIARTSLQNLPLDSCLSPVIGSGQPLPYLHLSSRVNGVKFFLAAVHCTCLRLSPVHARPHARATGQFKVSPASL